MTRYGATGNSASLKPQERRETIARITLLPVVAYVVSVTAIIGSGFASADEAMEAPLLSYQVGEDGTISALMRDGDSYTPLSVDQRIGLPLPEELGSLIEDVLNSDDPDDVLDYVVVVKQKGELVFLRRAHCHAGDCHCHPPC